MANSPTNSRPEDIAGWADALNQAMAASEQVQAQGSAGTLMQAESTQQPDRPGLLARSR